MLIIGAKGHANEILGVIKLYSQELPISFFDNVSTDLPELLFNKYKILRTTEEVKKLFASKNDFILGIGGCQIRAMLYDKFTALGGVPYSIVAPNASIGTEEIFLGKGINIMQFAFVSNNVCIGDGTLVNVRATIQHDVLIGKFCEISPSAVISGGAQIGDKTFIGPGSIILPKIKIGTGVVINAGSVVTENIPNQVQVSGNPARIIKE